MNFKRSVTLALLLLVLCATLYQCRSIKIRIDSTVDCSCSSTSTSMNPLTSTAIPSTTTIETSTTTLISTTTSLSTTSTQTITTVTTTTLYFESCFGDSTFDQTPWLNGTIYFLDATPVPDPMDFSLWNPARAFVFKKILNINNRYCYQCFPPSNPKDEWVGVVYTKDIYLDSPGQYNFKLCSDDGAQLYLDGMQVIDNYAGANHAYRCNTGTFDATTSDWIPFELRYNQGPCDYLGLELYVSTPNRPGCDFFNLDHFFDLPPSVTTTNPSCDHVLFGVKDKSLDTCLAGGYDAWSGEWEILDDGVSIEQFSADMPYRGHHYLRVSLRDTDSDGEASVKYYFNSDQSGDDISTQTILTFHVLKNWGNASADLEVALSDCSGNISNFVNIGAVDVNIYNSISIPLSTLTGIDMTCVKGIVFKSGSNTTQRWLVDEIKVGCD